MSENINHPKHYTECSLECIDAMQIAFGEATVYSFCLCNAFKYLWRYQSKNGIEDLKKAEWYLNKAKEMQCFDDDITLSNLYSILKKHISKFE